MVDAISPTGSGNQKKPGSDLLIATAAAIPTGIATYYAFPQKVTAKKLLGLQQDTFDKEFVQNKKLLELQDVVECLRNERTNYANLAVNTTADVDAILAAGGNPQQITTDGYIKHVFTGTAIPIEQQTPQLIETFEANLKEELNGIVTQYQDRVKNNLSEDQIKALQEQYEGTSKELRYAQNIQEIVKSADNDGIIKKEVLEPILKKHNLAQIEGDTKSLIKGLGDDAPKFSSWGTAGIVAGATAFLVYLGLKIFRKPNTNSN